jgi:hypothetical protein
MELLRKLKANIDKCLILSIFLFPIYSLATTAVRIYSVETSNYVVKSKNISPNYYGYDDDLDGEIDRIRQCCLTSVVLGRAATAIPTNRTYTPSDPTFDFHLRRLRSSRESD